MFVNTVTFAMANKVNIELKTALRLFFLKLFFLKLLIIS